MWIEEKQGKRTQTKEKWKFAVKDYEKLSKETALIVERFEMLVDKLKTKMSKDVFKFQNEEQLEEKDVRKEVDSEFYLELCSEELDEFYGSENEEEVESESEESTHDAKEEVSEEEVSKGECSKDETNDMEEIIRMHKGWWCVLVVWKCA